MGSPVRHDGIIARLLSCVRDWFGYRVDVDEDLSLIIDGKRTSEFAGVRIFYRPMGIMNSALAARKQALPSNSVQQKFQVNPSESKTPSPKPKEARKRSDKRRCTLFSKPVYSRLGFSRNWASCIDSVFVSVLSSCRSNSSDVLLEVHDLR